MKRLTIVVAMLALLPATGYGMAGGHHRGRGEGSDNAASHGKSENKSEHYVGGSAPVSVPEPGSLVLLATGLGVLGSGLLARRRYGKRT